MSGKKQIFFLMEQNTADSDAEDLILLTTDKEQLKEIIISEIEQGSMEYRGEDIDDMVENFKKDWKEETMDDINYNLHFGHYGYGINGSYGEIYGN